MAYPRAWIDETRARILADPVHLAHVIGAETEWFHKLWIEWTLRHPFTLLEGPRGFGKSYVATVIVSIWWILNDFNTRILVLEFLAQGRKTLIGLVADRVFEVTNLDDDRLDPAPDTGCRWRSDHIAGIGRRGDKFVVVLDLERLLSDDTPTLITNSTNLDAA